MKQNGKILLALALLAILTVTGCHRRPHDVLGEKQMVALLTDAYQLEGFYAVEHGIMTVGNPAVLATYDELFAKHNTTREQFDKSLEYYMRHANKYEAIHKQVVANLDDQIKQLGDVSQDLR